jgi:prepilin-type N-terminal cleavage/methylation domain-containing protein
LGRDISSARRNGCIHLPSRRGWSNVDKLPEKGRASGFTLFELILVIVLVAVFSGMLLGRFLQYQEMAEKAAMEQTAGAVRSALTIQFAGLITRGKTEDIPKLAALNPMKLLTDAQKNYVGEFYETSAGDIPPGSWYFDLKRRHLVYIVRNGANFVPQEDGAKEVRYRVSLVYNDWQTGSKKTEPKEVAGIALKEVQPYSWQVN